jgi:hypothetical protein
VCNSHDTHEGKACGDPFDPSVAVRQGLLKDCSDLPEDVGTARAHNYTLCRKYVQDSECLIHCTIERLTGRCFFDSQMVISTMNKEVAPMT